MPQRKVKRVCDAAVIVLERTDNAAVMAGDGVLLHQIADEMGWDLNGPGTEKRVLDALSRTPGTLIKKKTRTMRGRLVRIFRLPEKTGDSHGKEKTQ